MAEVSAPEVSSKLAPDFLPTEGKIDPDEVVLVFPGKPARAKASALWTLPQQMSEGFKARTIMVDAAPEGQFHSNATDLMAEGIRRLIEKRKFKKVSIVGHSLGSVVGVNLVASLQKK